MSVMSFATINQDKYYIAPDADLDEIVGKLMNKKSKGILKLEQKQEKYAAMIREQNKYEMDELMGEKLK